MNHKELKRLVRQKKFEQIYQEYGPYYFRKYVSNRYKKAEIKKLKEEGKYLEIYEKYGETYKKTKQIENQEDEKGVLAENKSSRKSKSPYKKAIIRAIKGIVIIIACIRKEQELGPIIDQYNEIKENAKKYDEEIAENAKKYEKEIEEYEREIKEYSKEFDSSTQSDMKIIMRMMKDIHETMQGYGTPSIEARGYFGMAVMGEEGIGECRNIAEKMADELNEVNPEYNARVFALYMQTSKLKNNNIEMNTIINENQIMKIKGNVGEIYEYGQLIKRIIEQEDSSIIEEYEGEKIVKRTLQKENQKEEIDYDENGNVIKNIIVEKRGNIEIQKVFINNRLERKSEIGDDYYKNIIYDNNGRKSSITIADIESAETTIYHENGQVDYRIIIQDGYKTTIYYDEQEKEVAREKEKTEEWNIFLEMQQSKEIKEESKETSQYNHAMVAIDIKSDNLTLLIDATTLSLGYYKDGKMEMFNETKPEEASYIRSLEGETELKGTKALKEYPIDYIKSFMEPKLSREELQEKYGLKAQNKMLEQIEKEDSKKTFKEELKIDTGISYNFETNVVTIQNYERREETSKEH